MWLPDNKHGHSGAFYSGDGIFFQDEVLRVTVFLHVEDIISP